MDDVPFIVDQNVPIVPILDLKEVGDKRIGCLGFDEVVPSLLEVDVVLGPEFVDEVLVEGLLVDLPDSVS